MAREQLIKQIRQTRRTARTRAAIRGTARRPRLSVFRSAKHMSAQLIDDATGRTLASASDLKLGATGKPRERAKAVGRALAQQAVAKKITHAVFDRGRYRYHGRVQALAEGAREGGLKF